MDLLHERNKGGIVIGDIYIWLTCGILFVGSLVVGLFRCLWCSGFIIVCHSHSNVVLKVNMKNWMRANGSASKAVNEYFVRNGGTESGRVVIQ